MWSSVTGHLVMSANQSIFVELMAHVLDELKTQKDTSNTRTFIQCIGAIWYVLRLCHFLSAYNLQFFQSAITLCAFSC